MDLSELDIACTDQDECAESLELWPDEVSRLVVVFFASLSSATPAGEDRGVWVEAEMDMNEQADTTGDL